MMNQNEAYQLRGEENNLTIMSVISLPLKTNPRLTATYPEYKQEYRYEEY